MCQSLRWGDVEQQVPGPIKVEVLIGWNRVISQPNEKSRLWCSWKLVKFSSNLPEFTSPSKKQMPTPPPSSSKGGFIVASTLPGENTRRLKAALCSADSCASDLWLAPLCPTFLHQRERFSNFASIYKLQVSVPPPRNLQGSLSEGPPEQIQAPR